MTITTAVDGYSFDDFDSHDSLFTCKGREYTNPIEGFRRWEPYWSRTPNSGYSLQTKKHPGSYDPSDIPLMYQWREHYADCPPQGEMHFDFGTGGYEVK